MAVTFSLKIYFLSRDGIVWPLVTFLTRGDKFSLQVIFPEKEWYNFITNKKS